MSPTATSMPPLLTASTLPSTRKAAEERLVALGQPTPSRLLPCATAPPQLTLAV